MYIIRIVPVNPEILCRGLQPCKTADRFIRIGNALRIRILRHTPDALDRRVLAYQLLYHIHIRPFGGHGYVNHFNTKIFSDGKMPVIAGNRA